MIAVIFEVRPADGSRQPYLDLAAELRPQLERIDGFISIERFQSLSAPGEVAVAVLLARRGGGGGMAAPGGPP